MNKHIETIMSLDTEAAKEYWLSLSVEEQEEIKEYMRKRLDDIMSKWKGFTVSTQLTTIQLDNLADAIREKYE